MEVAITSLDDAIKRIHELLASTNHRIILGIVGEPGAGKSTFANQILDAMEADTAALVPMDGFHYSNKALTGLGRRERKGAPDTFDASGFIALLKRIKTDVGDSIYFPIFHREIEESIAAEGVIKSATRLIVVEGNYLLLDAGDWAGVSSLLDECWYIVIDSKARHERLVARHQLFGKDPESARKWALGSDENNAKVIATTRNRANRLVTLEDPTDS